MTMMRGDESGLLNPFIYVLQTTQHQLTCKRKLAHLTAPINLRDALRPPWANPSQSPRSIRRMEEKRSKMTSPDEWKGRTQCE
jgi:hypothetical protein